VRLLAAVRFTYIPLAGSVKKSGKKERNEK